MIGCPGDGVVPGGPSFDCSGGEGEGQSDKWKPAAPIGMDKPLVVTLGQIGQDT